MTSLEYLDVQVSGAGADGLAIDGISLSYAVGAIPQVHINIHEISSAKDGGIELKRVLVADETDKMARFQQAAFEGEASRISVTVKSGDEQTLEFSGSVLGPTRKVYSSFYSNGVKVVHDLEAVNSYVPHIYSLSQALNRSGLEFEGSQFTNVFGALRELLKKRHKDFEVMFATAKFNDPASKESIQQLHERNMQVFPIVEKILTDSETLGGPTYEGFADFSGDALKELNRSIFSALMSTVFRLNSQFFYALVQLAEEFQSFYVPPYMGSSEYGYFRSHRHKVEEGEPVQPRIVGASLSSTVQDRFPVQQVIVSGQPPALWRQSKENQNNIYQFLGDNPTCAVFPRNPPKENGNNYPIPIPSWIPSTLLKPDTSAKGQASRDLELFLAEADDKNLSNLIQQQLQPAVQRVVEELAETTYKNIALANYLVEVNSLLNFDLHPGRSYNVQDEDGRLLFTGFLYGVTHNISGLASTLDASTSMSFYAVKYSNFTLPE